MRHQFYSAVLWQIRFSQIPVDWEHQPYQPTPPCWLVCKWEETLIIIIIIIMVIAINILLSSFSLSIVNNIMTRSNHLPTMFDRPGGGRKKCTCGGKVHLHIKRKCFTHSGSFLKTNHFFSDNVVFLAKCFQARSTKYSAPSDWFFFVNFW